MQCFDFTHGAITRSWRWLGLLSAVLLVFACGNELNTPSTKAFSPLAESLETEAVAWRVVASETSFDGVVEAVNQAVVSAQTSGRIVELPFDVGDYVAQGDVIARFTDAEQQAALRVAQARVEEANARFTEADEQLARVADVYARGMVAKAGLDQAKATQQAALARSDSARAGEQDAHERLAHTVVIAPYSGIVVKRLTDVGATVVPGSPLLEGLSLQHLRVQVDVPQDHIGLLRKHKKARVILANGDSVAVTDIRIPPSAKSNTHSFGVLLTLPEGQYEEPVFPGTLVKVALPHGEQRQLLVPEKAVARRGEVTALYIVSQPEPNVWDIEFRYVRLGTPISEHHAIVLSGLEAGEQIALDHIAAAAAYKMQTFN